MSTIYKDDLSTFSPPSMVARAILKEVSSLNKNTHKAVSILDVGCNKGYFGKRFKEKFNFYCEGLEIDKDDATEAKKVYDNVALMDLNDGAALKNFLKDKIFDYIVCLDILEHLVKPEDTLAILRNHLHKDSKIFVSLPNVANFTTRIPLMFGKFQYANAGILDRTHLHLYTAKTGYDLLIACNYDVLSVQFASNRFGRLIACFPFLGTLLGYNLIYTATYRK